MAKRATRKIDTWEGCDAVLGQVRNLNDRAEHLRAEKATAVQRAGEPFGGMLDDIAAERKPLEAGIRTWCKTRRGDFGDARSRQLDNGVVGWRLGNRTLALLSKAKTWPAALIKVLGAGKKVFVRVVQELAKDRILDAHKAGKLSDEQLAAWDLRVTQAERFFVDPKADEGRDREGE